MTSGALRSFGEKLAGKIDLELKRNNCQDISITVNKGVRVGSPHVWTLLQRGGMGLNETGVFNYKWKCHCRHNHRYLYHTNGEGEWASIIFVIFMIIIGIFNDDSSS